MSLTSSTKSVSTPNSESSDLNLSQLPTEAKFDVTKFAASKQGKALAVWVGSEYTKSKAARGRKQLQWYTNMAYFFGKQWVERTASNLANGYGDKLFTPKKPYYSQRKTINRTRSIVRSELSRFMSTMPTIVGVPSSAQDQDIRAAYAAEQAWESIQSAAKLRTSLQRTMWWTIITGNGFHKTWWDGDCDDKASGQPGTIRFATLTPFHLFIPDLREQEIEDQPYVITAQIKPTTWCQQQFKDELGDIVLKPSTMSGNQILDDGHLNLSAASNVLDSSIIYEAWVKPGATTLLPEGGVVISIDDTIVRYYGDGLPYDHGQYPFTKFEHIPTSTFYADSPLVDTNPLQREYNKLRGDIADNFTRMGRSQLLAQKGSIVPQKVTNEPGLIIEYTPGSPPPQQLQPLPIPEYGLSQQDRILADIEDLTGQHDVSKGSAPPGVTAGTAINYLQEKDNQFLTPEYNSLEDGVEKIAGQSIQLFVQYVDIKRKIKTIGADGAFDTVELSGADLKQGTDVRVEPGSSVGTSQAAKRAQIMDLWNSRIITDPNMALKLMEVGGPSKTLDIFNAAERKAQRENIRMKMLEPEDVEGWLMKIQQEEQQFQMQQELQQVMQAMGGMGQDPMMMGAGTPPPPMGMPDTDTGPVPVIGQQPPEQGEDDQNNFPPDLDDQQEQQPPAVEGPPLTGAPGPQAPMPGDPNAVSSQSPMGPLGTPPPQPIIPVDDFDVHEQHIITHNVFRMSQEYELLSDGVKNQFKLHVQAHMAAAQRAQIQQFTSQIPSDGTDPNAPQPQNNTVDTGAGGSMGAQPPQGG